MAKGKYANALMALATMTEVGKYAMQKQVLEEEKLKEERRYQTELKRQDEAISRDTLRYNNEQKYKALENLLSFKNTQQTTAATYGIDNITFDMHSVPDPKNPEQTMETKVWRVKTTEEGYDEDKTPNRLESQFNIRQNKLGEYGYFLEGETEEDTDKNIAEYETYKLMGLNYDSRGTMFNNPNLVAKDIARGQKGNFNDLDLADFEDFLKSMVYGQTYGENPPEWVEQELISAGLMAPGENWEEASKFFNIRWTAMKSGIKDDKSHSGYLSRLDQEERDLKMSGMKQEIVTRALGADMSLKLADENLKANQQQVITDLRSYLTPDDDGKLRTMNITTTDGKGKEIDFGDADWQKQLEKAGRGSLGRLIEMSSSMDPNSVYEFLASTLSFNENGYIISWGDTVTAIVEDNAYLGDAIRMGMEQYVKYNMMVDRAVHSIYGEDGLGGTLEDPRSASGFNLALNMLREGNYFNKLRNDATKDEALNAIGQVLDNFETGYKKNSKQDAMAKSELSKLMDSYINMFLALPETDGANVEQLESLLEFGGE